MAKPKRKARPVPPEDALRPTQPFPGQCPCCQHDDLQTRGWCFECGQVVWCPRCGAFGHDNGSQPAAVTDCVWRSPEG